MKNLKSAELPPALYLVSTPIGNLRDITLRALDILQGVDVILCEDSRVTGKLLQVYDITDKKLSVYNDHSSAKQRAEILSRIASGARVGLVSDAGTPLVSDPGYKLVRDAQDLGLVVTSAPGANAPLTALQLSGLPSDAFAFIGFLPSKTVARKKLLAEWKNIPGTLLAFETGPRLLASLKDMQEVLGNRSCCVVREMTKIYEQARRHDLPSLIKYYEEAGAPKGEIVIVLEAVHQELVSDEELQGQLQAALKTMKTKEAANFVAEVTGQPKKKLYEMALSLSSS